MAVDLLAAKLADRIGFRICSITAHIFCTAGLLCMGDVMGSCMFTLLALGGDIGCAAGPTLVGFLSNAAGSSLKTGFLFALIFPVGILFIIAMLRKPKISVVE